jgi:hypothetical protein
LLELRALAKEASDTNDTLTQRFHELLRSVSNRMPRTSQRNCPSRFGSLSLIQKNP